MNPASRSAFANHLLIYTLVAIGFSGSIGVGTVWMQHQISLVAKANKKIEASLKDCERQSEQATTEIEEEQDVSALLARNTSWNLGLVAPGREAVQQVTEDPIAHLALKHNREVFSEANPSISLAPISIRLALQR
jgi:hypothetical protein